MSFSMEELLRYKRHLSLNEVGTEGQAKLKQSKVLCIGAGGLGSSALLYLSAVGVGTLGIVDADSVELSNLQRQIMYTTNDIGKEKVFLAQEKIVSLNSNVKVIPYNCSVKEDNIRDIISEFDIIIDCTDNFTTRYLINDACFHQRKSYVYASISKFVGICSVFCTPTGPCYRCLFPEPPPRGLIPNCAEGGVIGVLPGLLGCIQANEVIKLILDIGEPLVNRMMYIDILSMSMKKLIIKRNEECLLCKHGIEFDSLKREPTENSIDDVNLPEVSVEKLKLWLNRKKIYLLDVRKLHEHNIFNIGGNLISLNELNSRIDEIPKNIPVVIYCETGVRSKKAQRLLIQAGYTNIYQLTGGVSAWI